MVIDGITIQPPSDIENHESLVLAVYHRLMPNQSKQGGGSYQTIPQRIKIRLANSTGGCSKNWVTNTQQQREDWWHSHYDNLRFCISNGDEGREGGAATQNKMRSAHEYWTNNPTDALHHAMTCFYKGHAKDERDLLIQEMGENPDDWSVFIAAHGQEFIPNENGQEQGSEEVIGENDPDEVEDPALWEPDDGDWIKHLGAKPPSDYPLVSLDSGIPFPRNRIVYGGPGTGKSYRLNEDAKSFSPSDVTRVTFHPDYTNGSFVGSYRPVPVFEDDDTKSFKDRSGVVIPEFPGTPHILYEVVSGPFLDALVNAFNTLEDGRNHLLIIEEINRANPSAILGDVFQMLDRREDGFSEYPVSLNPEIMEYLQRKITRNIGDEVGLPPNLFIWATMNTTDEGVFPVDSAFRRRWTMEHVSVNEGESVVENWQMPSEFSWLDGVSWNTFRKKINEAIILKTHSREDQLLGPFFFSSESELVHSVRVKNKLLDYLHQSLLRHSPGQLFRSDYGHGEFSKLMDEFDNTNVFENIDFKDSSSEDEEATEGGSSDGSAEEE